MRPCQWHILRVACYTRCILVLFIRKKGLKTNSIIWMFVEFNMKNKQHIFLDFLFLFFCCFFGFSLDIYRIKNYNFRRKSILKKRKFIPFVMVWYFNVNFNGVFYGIYSVFLTGRNFHLNILLNSFSESFKL